MEVIINEVVDPSDLKVQLNQIDSSNIHIDPINKSITNKSTQYPFAMGKLC